MKHNFSSKIVNLKVLKKKQKKQFCVPEFKHYNVRYCILNPKIVYKEIKKDFRNSIIIRSASQREDSRDKSLAGKFDSHTIFNLTFKNFKIGLLHLSKKLSHKYDRIIIQKFIKKPEISGVLFTRDPSNNSPYYIINYDTSGKTNKVTSGDQNNTMRVCYIYRNSNHVKKKFKNLLKATKTIESFFTRKILDIEFCIKKDKIFIFQCRELNLYPALRNKKNLDSIKILEKKMNVNFLKSNEKTIYSNMADWNPVEMLGDKPSKLAISLYMELITDKIWSLSRQKYGYKKEKPKKLMRTFFGSPYINLRTDLRSFLPNGLDVKIENKLINEYLKVVQNNKSKHDKIEFEVVNTFFTSDNVAYFKSVLNKKQIEKYKYCINRTITKIFLSNQFEKDIYLSSQIDEKLNIIKNSKFGLLKKINLLISLCKNNGTMPFSGVARCAFVSTILLNKLLKLNIINKKDILNFYRNINLITNEVSSLAAKANKSRKQRLKFINSFGHLRPSTYDINSLNYSENFKYYFSHSNIKKISSNHKNFYITKNKKKQINNFLKKNDFDFDFDYFFTFTKKAIIHREQIKCDFSKIINEIFNCLIEFGKRYKLSRKDLENINIKDIQNNITNKTKLLKRIKKEQLLRDVNKLIKLPDVISNKNDFLNFELVQARGNYIGKGNIVGKLVKFHPKMDFKNLNNSIVLIDRADPGYDFLFSFKIKGLITKYGGPNSHMAIRCYEENILACIGYGGLFDNLNKSKNLFLDCDNKKIYNF
jgi:phosphohistidine swiveling domain-containing protein